MAEKGKAEPLSPLESINSPTPSVSKMASNVARIQRNIAEKQRRDKLNGYISELANIVPMVSMSSKRLDKTSILRLSAAHLRISKSVLGGSKKHKKGFKWCPSFLTSDQAREMLESVDGFLIVTTSSGKILFTSRSVERYLGHQDIEMIGHSLFIFIHPHDLDMVKDELEKLLLACLENGKSHRCSFRCRIKERAQPRSEVVTYQYVEFMGNMAACDEEKDGVASKSVVNHMFKAFIKLVDVSPYNQLSLAEATADEYVTRHSLDGTIIFADHRLATITGHLPHEVVGLSAYEYIHAGDTSIALFAHQLMFSNDKGTGMIVYRLRTRDDRLVYLKSVGCLQYDKVTKQLDHFVCVNQQLNESEGDSQLRYFVDRYIPHIKGCSASSLFESVKALQGSKSDKANGLLGPLKAQNSPVSETSQSADAKSKCEDPNSESSCHSPESQNSLPAVKDGSQPVGFSMNETAVFPLEQSSGSPVPRENSTSITNVPSEDYFDVSTDNSVLYVANGSSPPKSEVFHSDTVFSEMSVDSSFMIDKHLNDHAQNSAKFEAVLQNGGSSEHLENGNTLFSSVHFQGGQLLSQLGKSEGSGAKTLHQSPGSDGSQSSTEMYCKKPSSHPVGEDSNSAFKTEFRVCNGDSAISEALLDPVTSYNGYGEESHRSKSSLIHSEDSQTFLSNGSWHLKNGLKGDFDPMEYFEESLPFEKNGDVKKAYSVLQGDLSSLLETSLPHDSNSVLCANGWNEICSTIDIPREDDIAQPGFL